MARVAATHIGPGGATHTGPGGATRAKPGKTARYYRNRERVVDVAVELFSKYGMAAFMYAFEFVADKEPVAAPARPVAKEPSKSGESLNILDFDACLEQIWEQLIAVPPTRGRSMTTVKVGSARMTRLPVS